MPDCLPITVHAPTGVAAQVNIWRDADATAAAILYDGPTIVVAYEEDVLTVQNTVANDFAVTAGSSETVFAQPGTYWVSATVDGIEMAGGQGDLLRVQLEGGEVTVRPDKPVLSPSEVYAVLVDLGLIVEA
jgi:uncharacterized protein (AIM24 family)